MILVADSGSTKTDWALLHPTRGDVLRMHTLGTNPTVLPVDAIIAIIMDNEHLIACAHDVTALYFYGAGCSGDAAVSIMHQALTTIFPAATIQVFSDMIGAVHAVANDKPCIVAILGTGANSCLFNGKVVTGLDHSLGYLLGDEGSGAWFGKRLIRDNWYGWMPASVSTSFQKQYALTRKEILENAYRSNAPNAWLASFAPFVIMHQQEEYMQEVIFEGISDFFDAYITRFENSDAFPVHWIGSLACALEQEIRMIAVENQLTMGNFIASPINGLIQYHQAKQQ